MENENKKKYNLIEILLFILFLFTCFQNLTIFSIANGAISFKYSHFISLIFIPLIIKYGKVTFPPKKLLLPFIYFILLSIIVSGKYGIDGLFLNYIFCFYYLIIFCSLKDRINTNNIIRLIGYASWIILFSILIKDFIYRETIISFLAHPYGHPVIPTIFGGGVNLEATWIALIGFINNNSKHKYIYLGISVFISAIYASRVGILINILLGLYFVFNKFRFNINNITKIIIIILLLIVVIGITTDYGLFDYVFSRFLNTGYDPGSIGRLNMWKYVLKAFTNNPLGYGLGNSINAIERTSGLLFAENNIHNLLFQMLLDTGFIGFIMYFLLSFGFIIKNVRLYFENSLVAFIITYLLFSLFQFRGGDALFFFVIGLYLVNAYKKAKLKEEA